MPSIQAAQHLFASVERGYFPRNGRGFQTVAMTPELMGTEDLRVLEEVAFYTLSRERRNAGNLPIKETFLQLPSENYALGRTIYLGVDSLGREGNYLSHHLIINREELLRLSAYPFALLDAVEWASAQTVLKPRELPCLSLQLAAPVIDAVPITALNLNLLADLLRTLMEGGDRLPLLMGNDAQTRSYLQAAFVLVADEERLTLAFSTHFYESDHLRQYFRLAALDTMPSGASSDYRLFDVRQYHTQKISTTSAYSNWLGEAVHKGNLSEVLQVNRAINSLRQHQPVEALPENPQIAHVLWERVGTNVTSALYGNAARLQLFLAQIPKKRDLADALLLVSPSVLLGAERDQAATNESLHLLQSFASRSVWREWTKRWRDDPVLLMWPETAKSWWQFWK